jgi:Kef-type K+ transport system membrane component KefB
MMSDALQSPAAATDLTFAMVGVGLAVMLLACAVLKRLARRLRQPAVIAEIAAGIALGPSLLGLLPGSPDRILFPEDVRPLLSAIAQVGLLLFMFLLGWRTDAALLRTSAGHAASVSLCAVVLSFGCGMVLAAFLYGHHPPPAGAHAGFGVFALFLGTALAITAFPVLARILDEKRLTGTPVGSIALAAAAVDDVLAWCLLALCTALVTAHNPADAARTLVLAAVFVCVLAVAVRPLLAVAVRRATAHRARGDLLAVVAAGVFLSSYATTWIGIHAIFGAFSFGVIMPREPANALAASVRDSLEQTSLFLLPVFFVVTGIHVDLGALPGRGWLELAAMVALACAGKLLGTAIPARLGRMSWRDTAMLSLLMNTRGLTEIVVLSTGRTLGVIDGQIFTMGVLMALITTVLGTLVKRAPEHSAAPSADTDPVDIRDAPPAAR